MKHSLCDGWEFTSQWSEEFPAGGGDARSVRLPHTCKELPLHCIDPEDYQMLCCYRRRLDIPSEFKDKRLFLQLDGAAHIATVYVNGVEVGMCGTYVRSSGCAGTAALAVHTEQTEDVTIDFTVENLSR